MNIFNDFKLAKEKYESVKKELESTQNTDKGALIRNEQEFDLVLSHSLTKALQLIKIIFNKDLLLYTKGIDYNSEFKKVEMQVKRPYSDILNEINTLKNDSLTIPNINIDDVNQALDLINLYCIRNHFDEVEVTPQRTIEEKNEPKMNNVVEDEVENNTKVFEPSVIDKGVKIDPLLTSTRSISILEKILITLEIPFSIIIISLICLGIMTLFDILNWTTQYGDLRYWITVFLGFLLTLISATVLRNKIKVHYPFQGRYLYGTFILYGLLVYLTPYLTKVGEYIITLNTFFNNFNWYYFKVIYLCALTFFPIAYMIAVLFSNKSSRSSLLNIIIDALFIPILCYLDIMPSLILLSREIPFLSFVNNYAYIYNNLYIELIIGVIAFIICIVRDVLEISDIKKKQNG